MPKPPTAEQVELELAGLREACCHSLRGLASALGYQKSGPWAPFHWELMAHVEASVGGVSLILVPRGHLKTSLVTVSRCLQWILQDPSTRILLASSTGDLAQGILREIRHHLRNHVLFDHLAGPNGGWVDNADQVTVRRPKEGRTPTIHAVGVGATTTGEHFDHAIYDDIVMEDTCTTKEQLTKLREWYQYTMPQVDQGNRDRVVVGTPYHYGDLYADLLGHNEATKSMSKDVKVFKRSCTDTGTLEDGAKPLWPQNFTLERLRELRAGMLPALFASQYFVDPIGGDEAWFDRSQIVWMAENEVPDERRWRVTVTDWAATEKTTSDYTVMATVDVDYQGRKWVRRLTRGRWGLAKLDQAVEKLVGHLQTFEPDRVSVQKAILDRTVGQALRRRCAELGLPLPLIELSVTERSKFSRIGALQPAFAGGQIFFVKGCLDGLTADDLEDEIIRYPKVAHDDVLDALADVDRVVNTMPKKKVVKALVKVFGEW